MRSVLSFAAVLLVLPSCQGPESRAPVVSAQVPIPPPAVASAAPVAAPTEPTPAVEMKAYEVPGLGAPELASVLTRVLHRGRDVPAHGKVTAMNEGRVLVVAPPGIHAGIATLCEDLATETPSAPKTVEISYWIVYADSAEVTDTSAVPAVADALTEIARIGRPSRFTLAEQVSMSSLVNTEAKSSGKLARFEQVASVNGDTVVADLEIEFYAQPGRPGVPNRLSTRMTLAAGETVVVGTTGYGGDAQHENILYVVRAELADAG